MSTFLKDPQIIEHQTPDFYHTVIVNFAVFALNQDETETVKRSIKLTIKTSKLAEIASKNIIYISSCINQI